MAQTVDTALIAASASIIVGLIAGYAGALQGSRTRRLQRELVDEQHDLDKALESFRREVLKQAQEEQAALDAEEALELFRLPLQHAAEDLGHRIYNIQAKSFWE